MGLRNTIRSRSQPAKANLDALLALPAAAPALRAGGGLRSTGAGSVCVGAAGADALHALVTADSNEEKYDGITDDFGYRWLVRRTSPEDLAGLVADLHAVGASLDEAGVGSALTCAVVGFTDGSAPPIGLVYSFVRGAWYPFAPTGATRRDNPRELSVRGMLGDEVKVEPDLTRWFPVWGAPGL